MGVVHVYTCEDSLTTCQVCNIAHMFVRGELKGKCTASRTARWLAKRLKHLLLSHGTVRLVVCGPSLSWCRWCNIYICGSTLLSGVPQGPQGHSLALYECPTHELAWIEVHDLTIHPIMMLLVELLDVKIVEYPDFLVGLLWLDCIQETRKLFNTRNLGYWANFSYLHCGAGVVWRVLGIGE